MCKIIVIPNCSLVEKPLELAKKCAEILSDQRDGYGYAYQGERGVFGAKTLYPDAFAHIDEIPDYVESTHVDFGEKSKVTGAGIFHGRISTNNVSLLNTHPIQRDGWHLIHNGVVTNNGDKYNAVTTNDSEHVLWHLINGGIDSIAKHLTGYYAAAALSPDGVLHVFRDSTASLFYSYSKKLKSPIFSTTKENLELIGHYIKERLAVLPVKNNIYMEFVFGDCIKTKSFEPRGFDQYSMGLSSRSLGYDWNDFDEYDLMSEISESYLEEIKYLDESYSITSHGGTPISIYDFIDLPITEQVDFVVKRSDGTIVEPYDDSE